MEKWVEKNQFIALLLFTGAVYFFLQYLFPLMAPVFLAMLFVTMFGPILKKMQIRLHIPRPIGAVLLLLLAGVILTLVIWILFSWVVSSFPEWISKLDIWEEKMTEFVRSICGSIGKTLGIDSTYLENTITQNIMDGIDYLQSELFPGVLTYSIQYMKILGKLGAFLVTFSISVVLLAKDYDNILNKMLDRENYHLLLEIICGIIRYIASFVKAQLIILSIIAGVCAVTLSFGGLPHGALWGILAGVLDALPFIGTGIILVPLGISRLFSGYYGQAAILGVLYVVCIFIRELLEPKLVGKKLGVSPIAVLLSLYAGIGLFGVWGIVKGPFGFILIYQTYKCILLRAQKRERIDESDGPRV